MNNEYSKAYTEVLEIINHFSEDEYKKIPKEKIDFFEENKDKDYNFKIDSNVDLAEQNISQNIEIWKLTSKNILLLSERMLKRKKI